MGSGRGKWGHGELGMMGDGGRGGGGREGDSGRGGGVWGWPGR